MATTIIRPDAASSDSGFDQTGANLLSRINDNDTSTFVVNNVTTGTFSVSFDNNSAYSGATINNVVVSITGNTINSKVAEATLDLTLRDNSGVLQSLSLSFTPTESTQNGSAYSTSLTPSVVDALILNGTVEQAGYILKEIFITVDYTAAVVTTPFVGMKSGKYKIVSGKIKI